MEHSERLSVFISWSGPLAKEVATALREWLPNVLDINPWMSDIDVGAGTRFLSEIETALAGTRFGIFILTKDNQESQWLNFEAGAIANILGPDVRVVPLYVDLAGPNEITGPLKQFQAKPADRVGLKAIVDSIAAVSGANPEATRNRFDAFISELEARITHAKGQFSQPEIISTRSDYDLLNELLELTRNIWRGHSGMVPKIQYVDVMSPNFNILSLLKETLQRAGFACHTLGGGGTPIQPQRLTAFLDWSPLFDRMPELRARMLAQIGLAFRDKLHVAQFRYDATRDDTHPGFRAMLASISAGINTYQQADVIAASAAAVYAAGEVLPPEDD